MKTVLGLTKDARKLLAFLEKYPGQWHSYSRDNKTLKAVKRLMILYTEKTISVSPETNQIKLNY